MALVCDVFISKFKSDTVILDTLHGGIVGYDARPWTLVKRSSNSVTFSLVDPDGDQGFPGTVTTSVTYTVSSSLSHSQLALHIESTTART